jgi:hypothetical protein
VNRTIAAIACLVFCAFLAIPAKADAPQVQVRIPLDLRAGFATSAPAPDGMTYVTIDTVLAVNPSSTDFGPFEPHDFHLIAGDRVYYPVVRPGLGAIDLSWPGIVPPRGTLRVTVTFKVREDVTSADFEFIPRHWFADDGSSVAFCCLYK